MKEHFPASTHHVSEARERRSPRAALIKVLEVPDLPRTLREAWESTRQQPTPRTLEVTKETLKDYVEAVNGMVYDRVLRNAIVHVLNEYEHKGGEQKGAVGVKSESEQTSMLLHHWRDILKHISALKAGHPVEIQNFTMELFTFNQEWSLLSEDDHAQAKQRTLLLEKLRQTLI